MTTTQQAMATQVYRVYIGARPERIWQAITDPEWNSRYGYGAPGEFELRPGGAYRSYATEQMKQASTQMGYPQPPEVIVDGEVVDSEPPRRLVQTWRMNMDPTCQAEGFTLLTWEISEPGEDGVCRLTVTHDLTGAPATADLVSGTTAEQNDGAGGGGWAWVLSDLKTLLETGKGFAG
jgi:uncharacterized protein YndB with AHSA1/START domain